MLERFSALVIYLAFYSAVGWACEVLVCSISSKRFVNRGFLKGPYCPIYGVGALLILAATAPVAGNPLLVFLLAMAVATALEYFTSWLMETLFQMRWWDYSHMKYNLNGRVCLLNAILFGLMGLAMVYFLHPICMRILAWIPPERHRLVASAILALFFIDLLTTLNSLLQFAERLKHVQRILGELDSYNKEYAWFDRADLTGSLERLRAICAGTDADEALLGVLDKLELLARRPKRTRFERSFPNLRPRGVEEAFRYLGRNLEARRTAIQESWQSKVRNVAKRFGQKTAETAKEAGASFAGGMGFYKLFWVFVSGSVLGFVVETLYCLAVRGVLESRQGLLYGPFSQIYGLGAVLMVLLLTPLAKKSDRWLFLGGALLGGGFEWLSGVFQEAVFGTASWDYSDQLLSLAGGKTSVTYMFFWGILGFIFIKGVYPKLSRLIERMPNRGGKVLSLLLLVFLTADILLSCAAISRWSARYNGVPAASAFEEILDTQYPDEKMKEIYPNMFIVE